MNHVEPARHSDRAMQERKTVQWFCFSMLTFLVLALCLSPGLLQASDPYYAGTLVGQGGVSGNTDGTNSKALLNSPVAVTVDPSGNAIIADGNSVRKVTRMNSDVVLTTLAGIPGVSGSTDGTGSEARFRAPQGITCSPGGNLFVADTLNDCIRMVTPGGVVTTLAGMAGAPGSADGTNLAARFSNPQGIVVIPDGTVFVTDSGNSTVRKMVPSAGNWVVSTIAGLAGSTGTNDGLGASARFNGPLGIAYLAGNLLVCDFLNHTVRKLTPSGNNWVVSTLAGAPGSFGSVDGLGAAARFNRPNGIAVDAVGYIFVTDEANATLRKIMPAGLVSTVAGLPGVTGMSNGVGTEARFNLPAGLSAYGGSGVLLADYQNFTIRQVQFGAPLAASILGNRVVLSWSSVANDAIPQAKVSLSPGVLWTNVPGTVLTSGNRCYATNSYAPGSTYFRLYKP